MNKKALVTGSSRGIGKAIVEALAKDGYEVFVHCVNSRENAEAVAAEIINNGGKARVVISDLSKPEKAAELYKQTGDVDALILNASIQIRNNWEDITLDQCYTQLNCNYISSLFLIQRYVTHMKNQKWGRIVTIGSVQETKPHPDMLVYSSSKAAQTNMVESLSLQLARYGITVNNIAPGVIYTDRNITALADAEYARKVIDTIPVGFYGMPEDCAGMVRLICSDEGRYITGQSIYIDGGKSKA